MKLFSFPHLVIDELIKEFEPVELISLSLCSKKAHALVRAFSKIKVLEIRQSDTQARYGLCFPDRQPIVVWAASESGLNLETSELKTHQGSSFKLLFEEHGDLCTYWNDAARGCQEVASYVCGLFGVPVSTIAISGTGDSRLLDSIQEGQVEKLRNVLTLEEVDISAGSYSSFMSCNATEMLKVRTRPPRGYRFAGNLPAVKNLIIMDASWITTDHLLSLQSQNVTFRRSNLTTMDFCVLLRSWLSGGHPNLKYFETDVRVFPIEADIHEKLEEVQGVLGYTWKLGREYVFHPTNSFHLRREDNTVATIKILDRRFGGSITMVVWPDLNGHRV